MTILDWISENMPGSAENFEDRIEVHHDNDELSTLWLNKDQVEVPAKLERLKEDVYQEFDGVSLFSSTFRISSLRSPRTIGEVVIVSSLSDLERLAEREGITFPEEAVPFMREAGEWLYALSPAGRIYKFDLEYRKLSSITYGSIYEVLEEWLAAVSEEEPG